MEHLTGLQEAHSAKIRYYYQDPLPNIWVNLVPLKNANGIFLRWEGILMQEAPHCWAVFLIHFVEAVYDLSHDCNQGWLSQFSHPFHGECEIQTHNFKNWKKEFWERRKCHRKTPPQLQNLISGLNINDYTLKWWLWKQIIKKILY